MNKICTKCKENKNLKDYSDFKKGKFGKRPRCKICCSEDTKEWIKRNPAKAKENERIQNSKKDYAKEGKRRYEKNSNYYKEWYWSNPEIRLKKIEKRKEWALKNPLKSAEYAKKQRQINRQKCNARKKVKWAVNIGRLTRSKSCEMCGHEANRIEGHHQDYSKPLSVVWLCASCHRKIHKLKKEAHNGCNDF